MTTAASMFISRDFVHVESRITAQGTVWMVSDQWAQVVRSFSKPELVWLLGAGCRRIVMAMYPEVVSRSIFFMLLLCRGWDLHVFLGGMLIHPLHFKR